jgi:molybdopterin synthase sulfur carrier subunit
MPTIRLFAGAREAAGTDRATVEGDTVGAVLDRAVADFGPGFADLLPSCKVWVNGEPADRHDGVVATDEVAVLPPVSGGA